MEVHCNNVTTHNTIDGCGVIDKASVREPTDELQIGDPGFEVESGYLNETRTQSVNACV
jgi:hypothetical protein